MFKILGITDYDTQTQSVQFLIANNDRGKMVSVDKLSKYVSQKDVQDWITNYERGFKTMDEIMDYKKGQVQTAVMYGDTILCNTSWQNLVNKFNIVANMNVVTTWNIEIIFPELAGKIKIPQLQSWFKMIMSNEFTSIDDNDMNLNDWDMMGEIMHKLQACRSWYNEKSLCIMMGQGMQNTFTNPAAMKHSINQIKNGMIRNSLQDLIAELEEDQIDSKLDIYDSFGECNALLKPTSEDLIKIWKRQFDIAVDDKFIHFVKAPVNGCDRVSTLLKVLTLVDKATLLRCVETVHGPINKVAKNICRHGLKLDSDTAKLFLQLLVNHGEIIFSNMNGKGTMNDTKLGLIIISIELSKIGAKNFNQEMVDMIIHFIKIAIDQQTLNGLQWNRLMIYWTKSELNYGGTRPELLTCMVEASNIALKKMNRNHHPDQDFDFVIPLMQLEYLVNTKDVQTIVHHVFQIKSGTLPLVKFEFVMKVFEYYMNNTKCGVPKPLVNLFKLTFGIANEWQFDKVVCVTKH